MTVRTYSPKRVVCSVQGVPISGFADGTFVEVDRAEDLVTKDVGADGEVGAVISADRSGTITVTLQAVSASNDFLSGLMLPTELTGLLYTFPVQVVDASGRTVVIAPECWVKKAPKVDFAKDKGTRQWVLETGNIKWDVIGGN